MTPKEKLYIKLTMGMSKNNIVVKTLINKMFEIANHNVVFEDIEGRQDNWYQQWTMTEAQNEEWKNWGIAFLRKKKRWNKFLAEREMGMFALCYGL
jgi:hypothetical protein